MKRMLCTLVMFLLVCVSSADEITYSNDGKSQAVSIQDILTKLETATASRMGISAINTSNNRRVQYRPHERFPFCSTFKVIGVAGILKQSMTDTHLLQQRLMYTKDDVALSGYAPITQNHLENGMQIGELCAAAIRYSDNAAMNLLMKKMGGPKTVTAFARSIGDTAFRLDRIEPELNSAIPGDLRDTTTPAAMERSLQKIALGDVLALPQREQLKLWLISNTTGNTKIRAGLPQGWLVGDKTGGGGDYSTTNDIAVIWPPHCSPIVMAIYFTQHKKDTASRDNIIALITRTVINEFAKTDPCINKSLAYQPIKASSLN